MIVIDYRQLLDKIDNPPYTLYSAGDRAAWLDECITTAHAFEAEPVKHGRWELTNQNRFAGANTFRCTYCKNYFVVRDDTLNAGRGDANFCPCCGANMKGDVEIARIDK